MRAEGRPSSKHTENKYANKEELFLRRIAQQEKDRPWQVEYAEFISAYNADVELAGLPVNPWRTF